jgi:Flp pilus assembly protein protease CpaA
MTPDRLIGMAILIALQLPSLIALSERRRLNDGFRALLALAGLGYLWATGGFLGLMLGLVSGLGTLLLLTLIVACTQRLWRARLLSGGEIKQLAAGAAWLTPPNAMIYLLSVAILALVAAIVGKRLDFRIRNQMIVISCTLSLLFVFCVF